MLGAVLEDDEKVVVAGTVIRRNRYDRPTVVQHIFKVLFARSVRLNYERLLHHIS